MLALLALLMVACGPGRQADSALRVAVRAHHEAHPDMRLQDYYKTFYQDRFGPAHLIADTASVMQWLDRELAVPDLGDMLYEPAGFGNRFVRVYCRAVADSLASAEELGLAFIESANHVEAWPEGQSWSEEWEAIQQALRDEGIRPEGVEADSAEIAQMLSQYGDRAVSHSQAYRDAYAPHYRIVSRALFDSLFLPRFQEAERAVVQ